MLSGYFQRIKAINIDGKRKKELQGLEKKLDLKFKRPELLSLALTHRSYTNENTQVIANNERLEFLGDSVLGLAISHYLFLNLPLKAEGDLARIKSVVVSEEVLFQRAQEIVLGDYILMGKGEEMSGGRSRKSLLADAFEAMIGAYFLDSGFSKAKKFVLSFFEEEVKKVQLNKHSKKDYKTLLQEYVQKNCGNHPKYRLLKSTGPDHARVFWVEVEVDGQVFGPGKAKSKKEAERMAASLAYKQIVLDNK